MRLGILVTVLRLGNFHGRSSCGELLGPGIRRRRLACEQLEERTLLSIGRAGFDADAPVIATILPEPVELVDFLVSEATRDALALTGGPHGLIELGDGEIFRLATGPSPSEFPIHETNNVDAADTTNTDQVKPGSSLGLSLTGSGYTVGVWDGGLIRDTHQEFGGRVTLADSGSTHYHATHVGGTIGASGVVASAEGMATQVGLRSRDWSDDFSEMNSDAALIDVSNHSYGYVTGWSVYPASNYGFSTSTGNVDVWYDDRYLYSSEDPDFGKYGDVDRDLDQVLYDNPDLLSVWSAGNDRNDSYGNASGDGNYVAWLSGDPGVVGWSGSGWYLVPNSGATSAPGGDGNSGTGYDSLGGKHTAKNSLVVGAVNDITADPYTSGQIVTTSFSSYGPTDDGRVKPDVVGNGAGLYSTDDGSDTDYRSLSGTSMSAPNVSGTAVLLVEHFEDEFGSAPRSASTKGVLIHTASDAGQTGPDYAYGWGLVNAADAATFLTDAALNATGHSYFDERTYSGSEWTVDLDADGGQPLKATIVWTDPAGTAHGDGLDLTTPVLVNDLDLWITGPSGTSYPWTLDPANPTNAAVRTAANHVDNAEQVLIDAPVAGTYTIHVGQTGTVSMQEFSLLVSGAGEAVASGIDLRGTNFDVEPDNLAVAAERAVASLSVRNVRDTAAGAFDVKFYLSDDATIDPATDTLLNLDASDPNYDGSEPSAYHVAGLAASSTHSATVTLAVGAGDPFATDNDYYLGMFVDADGNVSETDETNNRNRGEGLDRDGVYYSPGIDFGDAPEPSSVTTTFSAGNSQSGNMFDIAATNEVTVTSFDGHPQGNTDYEVYYRAGSHLGFEDVSTAWTLVGSASGVVAQPQGSPTSIPIAVDVTIPAGETYAFYVTSTTSVNQNYSNGSLVGAVFASDANMQFLEGTGNAYPFGSTFSPRVFNGVIHYALPGVSYPTLLASDGARHAAVGPFLGSNRDAEPDGQPTAAADGDDTADTPDDEDGVIFTSALVAGQTATVDVTASEAGILSAWIDFGRDGDWVGAGEQIFTDVILAAGLNSLSFAVPGSAVTTERTSARFRFSSSAGLSCYGSATDGEVEDYAIPIGTPDLVLEIAAASISEGAGAAATRATVTRNSGTSGDLSVTLASDDTSEATVPATVTIPHGSSFATFGIDAVEDGIIDGTQTVTVTASAGGHTDATDTLNVMDNDAVGITVSPTSGLSTIEAGGTATFTVVLDTQPAANVTIGLVSDDTTEGAVWPTSLTFSAGDWSDARTVTVTGVDDAVLDGDIAYSIVSNPATSSDPGYSGLNPADVSLINHDDETLISGRKWSDLDGDGTWDLPSEPGLGGVTVYLDLNYNGQHDSGEPTTLTRDDDPDTPGVDETGTYSFADFGVGAYAVGELVPDGYEQTSPQRVQDEIARVSLTHDGGQSDFACLGSRISDDGRYVIFSSGADNLVPFPTAGQHVYLRDVVADTTELLTVDNAGQPGHPHGFNTYRMDITPGGRFSVFGTDAGDLVPGDDNDRADIYLRDRVLGVTERISLTHDGSDPDDSCVGPAVSDDGRYVVFQTWATNLVPNDTNGKDDVFLYDRQLDELRLISVGLDGNSADGYSRHPDISGDGRYVVFHSSAPNIVPEDTSTDTNAFRYDVQTGQMDIVSRSLSGSKSPGWNPTISTDGRFIAFWSSTPFVAGDDNNKTDIFIRDLQTSEIYWASQAYDGAAGNNSHSRASISADGHYVTFVGDSSNLVPNDTNDARDVFLYSLDTETISRVSVTSTGGQVDGRSDTPSVSAGGRVVAFDSYASNVVPNDTNDYADVFTFTRDTYAQHLASAVHGQVVGDLDFGNAPTFDFGDAPGPYPTTLGEDGARHVATGPTLGTNRDDEDDGQPSAVADGDDISGSPDDEDGVSFSPLTPGQPATMTVVVGGGGGVVEAWIDFNGDGAWQHPAERVFAGSLADGTHPLAFTVPENAVPGKSFARVRVSSAGGLAPSGFAADGEVEDHQLTIHSHLVARRVFYNNSYFDDPSRGFDDDNAIAIDKTALLPGQIATFANYTGYWRGMNGIMVDIRGLADSVALADDDFSEFVFKHGNDDTPGDWPLAPEPADVDVRDLGGGVHRVTIIWPDNVIEKEWLQVSVLATAQTGLAQPDVFFFGNAVGESGNDPPNAQVNLADFAGSRDHPHGTQDRAAVDDNYDYNRDSLVNAVDLAIARDHGTSSQTALRLIDLTSFTAGTAAASATWDASPQETPDIAATETPPQMGSIGQLHDRAEIVDDVFAAVASETLTQWEPFAPEATWESDLLEARDEEPSWNEDLAFAFALLQATEPADYNTVSELGENDGRSEWMESAWSFELPNLDSHRREK